MKKKVITKTKKTKPRIIVKKETNHRGISLRVSAEEFKIIKEKALGFFQGNISGWLRYTAMNYKPKAKELPTS